MFTQHRLMFAVLALTVVLSGILLLASRRPTNAATIVTANLSGSLEPVDLVNTLVGGGISVSNVTYTGEDIASGQFSGGSVIGGAGLGFDSGILISSGRAADAEGPNEGSNVTFDHPTAPGDSDLDTLSGFTTEDAAVLQFDFVPQASSVTLQYVFASDEYNEFVNSNFNDVLAFFINGTNCATVAGQSGPVSASINTINNGNPFGTEPTSNPQLFVNNEGGFDPETFEPLPAPFDFEPDGFTKVLTCTANVTQNATNTMKIAIADASDGIVDSYAFLKAGSFTIPTPTPARPGNVLGAATSVGLTQRSDPITVATGNYSLQHTDVAIAGIGYPLAFARSYNAQDTTAGRLGAGWQDNLNARLIFDGPDHALANVTAIQEDGRQDDYARLSGGSYVTPPSVFDQLTRDAGDGSFTLRRKDRSRLHFDSDGVLQSMEDRNGNLTALTYASGNLTTVTDPSGRTLTFGYDGSNRITSVTDPLGRVTTYGYDGDNNLTSVVDPENQTTLYTYDANHRMLTIVDPRGNTIVSNVYDSESRVMEQTNADGDLWTYDYGAGQTTETDPRGCETTFAYDIRYRTTTTTDCLGGVTSYTYDAYGSRDSVTDPLGRTTTMLHDSSGNLTQVADALGNTSTFTYSSEDDLLTSTDALGRVTTYTYDANGNVETVVDALTHTASFAYLPNGLVQSATDPRAHTSTFGYDVNGYRNTTTDALGHSMTAAYDTGGRMQSVTDALANTASFTYDDVDRMLASTDPLTHVTQFAYNANGDRTSVTDANANVTASTYDALGRLATVTDAEGGVTTYAYDEIGNRISSTDANNHTTTYAFDLLSRMTSMTDPMGNTTTYAYDPAGNRTTRFDAMGRRTNYEYDALNRLVRVCYPKETTTVGCGGIENEKQVDFAYDAVGNRVSTVDLLGTTSYAYDALNRLTQVTFPGAKVVSYQYDENGNRTRITYPDGKQVNYTYDNADRLATVTDWESRVTTYTYDNANRLVHIDRPNGADSDYGYDGASRLETITQPGADVAYTLDNVGNRTQRTLAGGLEVYTYDDTYRLTTVQYAEGDCQTYAYDPGGNRSSLTVTPGAPGTPCNGAPGLTAYSYDAADRITVAGTTAYEFNANGDQTRAGQRTFEYDREDRLTRVADWTDAIPTTPSGCANASGDKIVSAIDLSQIAQRFFATPSQANTAGKLWAPAYDFTRDGSINAIDLSQVAQRFGQKCELTAASAFDAGGLRHYRDEKVGTSVSSTRFYWDVAAPIPVIIQDSDGNSYAYGHDLLLEERAGTPSWPLQDGLGSTVAMTDAGGLVIGTPFKYDVFGASRGGGVATTEFTYTGEQVDGSGLTYLRARSYDAGTGRFVSSDPLLRLGFGVASFTYARSSPASLVDPLGLVECWKILRSWNPFNLCKFGSEWDEGMESYGDRLDDPFAGPDSAEVNDQIQEGVQEGKDAAREGIIDSYTPCPRSISGLLDYLGCKLFKKGIQESAPSGSSLHASPMAAQPSMNYVEPVGPVHVLKPNLKK